MEDEDDLWRYPNMLSVLDPLDDPYPKDNQVIESKQINLLEIGAWEPK